MKKALLAGLLCAGVAVARSSYGNGTIVFDNYDATPYMPVVYLSNRVGVADSNYHVDLLYAFGTQSTTNGMLDTGLSVAINPDLQDTTFGANHGYFQGGVVTIPGYSSGPVSFDVVCWLTVTEGRLGGYANYGLAVASDDGVTGQSAVFTEAGLATAGTPAYFAKLPGPDGAPLLLVGTIPEPSTFTLIGLCFAALALRRRRKALRLSAKISGTRFHAYPNAFTNGSSFARYGSKYFW